MKGRFVLPNGEEVRAGDLCGIDFFRVEFISSDLQEIPLDVRVEIDGLETRSNGQSRGNLWQ